MNGKDQAQRTSSPAAIQPLRPTGWRRWIWLVVRILLLAGAVWTITVLYQWLVGATAEVAGGAQMRLGLIAAILVVYALLIALPFVPGIEIGIMLLMIQGGQFAPAIYIATVSGLCLAFAVGHWLPSNVLERVLEDVRLHRVALLVQSTRSQSPRRGLVRLRAMLPAKLGRLLIGQRYLLIAILVNLPGNAVIGGGGGIALTVGLSRLYAPLPTLITFLGAVAPIPILVWLFDGRILTMIG